MMSWSSQKKKSALVVSFILSKGDSFNTFGLSQCIVYWINFQTIYTFTFLYKKLHQFIHFWCLFFELEEAFIVSLENISLDSFANILYWCLRYHYREWCFQLFQADFLDFGNIVWYVAHQLVLWLHWMFTIGS